MADHGATVVIADVLEDEGRAVAESIGSNAYFVSLDVTDEAAWQRAVDHVLQTTGHIDVLVNNAAVLHLGSIQNTDADAFRRVLDVNATGPFLGIRAVVDPMTQRGGGSIINISSVDGLVPLNGMSAYVTSKWGLRGLTKTAALELGRAGITVNCICPTGGNSQMTAPWWDKLARFQDELDSYGQSRGIPRTSRLEEIADAVVFLASDMARFITGIDLPVDGGHTAGNHLEAFAHVDDRT
jgi:3alpha(or 20beta)-hydroxysteroid dehydrogenase